MIVEYLRNQASRCMRLARVCFDLETARQLLKVEGILVGSSTGCIIAAALRYCREQAVDYDVRDAFTYAGTPDGVASVRREYEACAELGLAVEWQDGIEPPIPCTGAVRLPDQAQLDPMPLLAALTADARGHGTIVVEQVRVTGVQTGRDVELRTAAGTIRADSAVLATGVPFLDRGLYFAKVTAQRSYALGFRVSTPIPRGMYISADAPTRSLRTALHEGEELLLVGGNGHPVGRQPKNPSDLVADLTAWTSRWFSGAERTHVWSAQDYEALGGVPFVGKLPRGGGHVYLATGYSKWGMTNAVAAALRISGDILQRVPPWARTLGTRVSKPASAAAFLRTNVAIGVAATQGWLRAELHPLQDQERNPAEGTGVVGAVRGEPVAISTVAGEACALSAICTHLGGVVRFNDLEKSWDCPLHGSRFAADGTVLEGPATRNLNPRPS